MMSEYLKYQYYGKKYGLWLHAEYLTDKVNVPFSESVDRRYRLHRVWNRQPAMSVAAQ
jgi:hypothetical protein